MINKDRLRLGIEALRSGEFIQGHGALKQGVTVDENGEATEYWHCCLGVLTEVALRNGLVDEYDNFWNSGGTNNGDLPPAVANWYGFEAVDVDGYRTDPNLTFGEETYPATVANDEKGYDFNQIADAFERLIED